MLRSRIFWSAYSIDRYLSQTLDIPVGYQDTDVDVCPPGVEFHIEGSNMLRPDQEDLESVELMSNTPARISRAFSDYCRLAGQANELFIRTSKSQEVDRTAILTVKAEIEAWWNFLPEGLTSNDEFVDLPFDNSAFFSVCYQHLLMLVNRPALSLSPSNSEFRYALQSSLTSARTTLLLLTKQLTNSKHQKLFWPMYLYIVSMSGRIISCACQLKLYSSARGLKEIQLCIPLLENMTERWPLASNSIQYLQTIISSLSASQGQDNRPKKRPYDHYQMRDMGLNMTPIRNVSSRYSPENRSMDTPQGTVDIYTLDWVLVDGE
ncbi:uncharacterized protein V1510DRAFT_414602 [Dipodascopsis tothii]|uniref:uncharacterized protein n=1 Tax=Dipodascopsis tothii TaxID=44089 RepID=UPI0034CDFD09